jgi:hypothetical protein
MSPPLTRSQVPCWTHSRVQLRRVAESWDLRATPDFQHYRGVEGRARSPGIKLGRGTRLSSLNLHPKPTTRGLVCIREHPWVLGQAMGTLTHKTHHDSDSGEATTFPHIVFSAAPCGSYIRMTHFPRTPKEESRNCPGLDSRDFGHSQLLASTSDWSEVWTKVVALLKSFPTPHRTPSENVGKRSIPEFLWSGVSWPFFCP